MIKESTGKHFNSRNGEYEIVYCPCHILNCPYYENGICYISDPVLKCDDWELYYDSWEDWELNQ